MTWTYFQIQIAASCSARSAKLGAKHLMLACIYVDNSCHGNVPLCSVTRAFHRADIAIGFHGAGLSNAYYMRPGGVVVEVVYDYDAR